MISEFGTQVSIRPEELRGLVVQTLENCGVTSLRRVLVLPPDHTRLNSMAGPITAMVYELLTGQGGQVDILPTLGTHNPMTEAQLRMMFGESIPLHAFKVHDWRNGIVRRGEVPGDRVAELSGGRVDFSVPRALKDLYAANPEALMFGTDLPSTRAARPYSDNDYRMVRETLGEEAAQRVFLDNARAFYRTPGK